MTHRAKVEFCDARGRPQEALDYVLDLNFYYGLMHLTEYGMHDAAKALREMRKLMDKWTGHRGRLAVQAFDGDYDLWSDKWQHEQGGRYPSLGIPYPAGRKSPSKFRQLREPFIVRVYWNLRLPVLKLLERRAERREQRRLVRAARPDLLWARLRARGEDKPES